MLKLETKSDSFDLSLVDMVINIPVGYKRGTVAPVSVCHISCDTIEEKEDWVIIIALLNC